MTAIRKASRYFSAAPRRATQDVVGLVATAGIVFIGFNLPAFF